MANLNDHIKNVCKIGQGHQCCRYLVVGKDGFECAKNTELKKIIDNKVNNGQFTAQGDNCPGKENKFLN